MVMAALFLGTRTFGALGLGLLGRARARLATGGVVHQTLGDFLFQAVAQTAYTIA